MMSAERRKVSVLEMHEVFEKYCCNGVSRMDTVRNEEVRRRACIKRELASIDGLIKEDFSIEEHKRG